MQNPTDQLERDRLLRERAEGARRAHPNPEEASRRIRERFESLPAYRAARTVMLYVAMAHEVRTRPAIEAAWEAGKTVVVPYCANRRLELFQLQSLGELAPGTWGIPEPKAELRADPARRPGIDALDPIMVPGVAFDRRGGRVGHGARYYDRLLAEAPAHTPLAGVAYACQVFDEVPMLEHDVFVHFVVTEHMVYAERAGDSSVSP